MTREEMIAKLDEYCHNIPPAGCSLCPVRKAPAGGFGCEKFSTRPDEELAVCVEKITPAPVEAETAAQVCENVADEEVQPVRFKATVDRDVLLVISGKLLMLSSCIGATITSTMADELLYMAESIENELKGSEVVFE